MKPNKTKSKSGRTEYTNNSLVKAFRILCALSEDASEKGVIELANKLKINKSTVHRMLTTMQKVGLIEKNGETEKYRLGMKLFELGSSVVQQHSVCSQARPYLVELAKRANETVHLAFLSENEVVYLDKIESNGRLLTIPSAVGRRLPAHCTGVGKALLAYLPNDDLEALVAAKGLKRFTANTITHGARLMKHLEHVRQNGYSVDNEEIESGLSCVGVPVRNFHGTVIASISIAGPAVRFRGQELQKRVALAKNTALQISQSLGYRK